MRPAIESFLVLLPVFQRLQLLIEPQIAVVAAPLDVAFADGHCEKLRIPYTGNAKKPQVDDGNLKELTTWLCAGKDVSLNGKKYEKLEN